MSDLLDSPVLITGAAGGVGRQMVKLLATEGWTLRLSDIAPYPETLPKGATFVRCDLGDGLEVLRLAEGCRYILHFGGASTDSVPFEGILNANLRGLYHVYEAARRERARVVFASSNHVVGFHERTSKLDDDCPMLPDSFYGLSKAYGELMGQLYWKKHGVESVLVRIGSCFPEPYDARGLATWLSYPDLARLLVAAGKAESVGCRVIWGASNNSRSFWGHDGREALGWVPQDSADAFIGQLEGRVTDNPVVEKYQGGVYTGRG